MSQDALSQGDSQAPRRTLRAAGGPLRGIAVLLPPQINMAADRGPCIYICIYIYIISPSPLPYLEKCKCFERLFDLSSFHGSKGGQNLE